MRIFEIGLGCVFVIFPKSFSKDSRILDCLDETVKYIDYCNHCAIEVPCHCGLTIGDQTIDRYSFSCNESVKVTNIYHTTNIPLILAFYNKAELPDILTANALFNGYL